MEETGYGTSVAAARHPYASIWVAVASLKQPVPTDFEKRGSSKII
jgi:hypothetical protein